MTRYVHDATAFAYVILLACLCDCHVAAYSTGAPAEGCWNQRPLHADLLPQGGPSLPYRLVANATEYGPGDCVVVKIEGVGTDPPSHKGFLLLMVSSESKRGGRWAVDRRVNQYNPECGVTHKDARSRSRTVVLWKAPSVSKGHLGRIQFRAIVAGNFTHFWDNIYSHSLVPNYPERGGKGTIGRYHHMLSILSELEPSSNQADLVTSHPVTTPSSSLHVNMSSRVSSTEASPSDKMQ